MLLLVITSEIGAPVVRRLALAILVVLGLPPDVPVAVGVIPGGLGFLEPLVLLCSTLVWR